MEGCMFEFDLKACKFLIVKNTGEGAAGICKVISGAGAVVMITGGGGVVVSTTTGSLAVVKKPTVQAPGPTALTARTLHQ